MTFTFDPLCKRSVSRQVPLSNAHRIRIRALQSVSSHRLSTFAGAAPDQKIQNLFLGFIAGVAFTSLYNREWPGYERRLRRKVTFPPFDSRKIAWDRPHDFYALDFSLSLAHCDGWTVMDRRAKDTRTPWWNMGTFC